MAKGRSVYTCTECGGQATKWQGQCPHCNEWNTLVETVIEAARAAGAHRFAALAGAGEVVTLGEVEARDFPRRPTLIGEFDRVLGGGLVEGGVVLIGGDPGIGKSTLLLQAARAQGDLGAGLFAGHVQRAARRGEVRQRLQQQGRLADAGVAADQHDAARD